MTPETRRKVQLALAAALAIAALRTGYIFYERYESNREPARQEAPPLKADYYVTPKKLYPYDLKSAGQLTRQPVWVREGYRYTFYPYHHRTDFSHEAGLLGPIQRLQIKDVVTDITPGAADQKQVMAVFDADGKTYAFSIGLLKDGQYQIYSDEMLYIQDPRELYKHWPADVWQAISNHEVKPGMSELQALFAVGAGAAGPGDMGSRTISYPNGGKPLSVTYRNDQAVEVKPGA
jgi:hypothetical protein